jgi:hypothetical protein
MAWLAWATYGVTEPSYGPRPCTHMPIFIDTHPGSELPVDEIREFLRAARLATRDRFGVRPLELYCGADGRLFRVVAADDEASVRRQHATRGAVCHNVRHVKTAQGRTEELGDEERVVVQQMLATETRIPTRVAS